ncbi:hypothetical protein DUNSADRAFT_8280 [Dunaliella salina]|uniref:Kinesin motor domain-containing protein n=1 Tax=Dunaliella salina TaxID=3046 RepID=A0ABQ7HA82_DUNSA|nr:hypothetical protein DUNSADRAFT_8280 [Dunaliella salina]|eukprot:KAF5843764.1 hypothetical protein DUNSADRAFT_8280 [Dunaliella salina]
MDKFKDLIYPENARVDIFETGGSTYNFTAKEVTVESPEQLQEILDNAEHVRKTSKTHMNTESSRSHACLMITIEKPWNGGGIQEASQFGVGMDLKSRLPPTPVRTPSYSKHMYSSPLQGSEGSEGSPRCVTQSTLFLVDLAGSERVGETGAVGEAAKEGASINNRCINTSLMNLRIIISDLRAGKRPPQGVYRRSKMTRLLQDSMGGNSNVLFIGCVTPSRFCDTDTKSTLQYAMKIAGITSTVAVNKKQIPSTMHAGEMIRALQMEVASLKSQLEALEKQLEASHQVHAADEDKIKRLETVILVQRTELEELQRKLQQEVEAGQRAASEAEAQCRDMQTSISGLETEKQALEDQLGSSRAAVSALESEKQELQTQVQHAQRAEAAAVAATQEAKQQVARLEEEAEEGMHREVRVKQQLEKVEVELEDSRRGAEQQQRHAEQEAELARLHEEEAAQQQRELQEKLQVHQHAAEEQRQLLAANTARLEEQLREQQRAAEEAQQAAEEQQQQHTAACARLEEQLREQQRAAEEEQRQHAADCIRFEEQLREQQHAAEEEQRQHAAECIRLEELLREQQQVVEEQQQQHATDSARLEEELSERQHAVEEEQRQHFADRSRFEEQLREQQRTAEEQQQQYAAACARFEEQLREQQRAAEEEQQQHAADCIRFEEQLREQQQVATAAQAAAAEVQQQLCAAQRQLEVSAQAAGDAACQLQAQLEATLAEQAAMANAHAAASASAAAELDAAKAIAQQMCESKEQQRAALEVQLEEQGTVLTQLQAVHASNQEQHERELANWEARLQDVQGMHAATQEQRERELTDWAARLQAVQTEQAEAAQRAEERLQAVEGELQSVQAERAQLQQALQVASEDAGEAANTMRQQLDSAQEEVQDLKQQLNSTREELQDVMQQLDAKVQELGVADQQLEGRAQELEASKTELSEVKQQMGTKEQELMASKEELGVAKQQLESKVKGLEAGKEELGILKQQLESRAQELEASKTECDAIKQQLESSSAEGVRLQQQLVSQQQEHTASTEGQQAQLESSAAEVVRLQQQLVSQQQEHAASTEEQQAQLEASLQEVQNKAQEVEGLKGRLEASRQQHMAEQQQQEMQLQDTRKKWGAVKQAALRVVQAAQEATSTMAARSAAVVRACHQSCAQKVSQELHALEQGWQDLQQVPAHDSALLHHLQWIQTRHVALQQEAADLRHQVLAQEVELGALKGVVAAAPLSELSGLGRTGALQQEAADLKQQVFPVQEMEIGAMKGVVAAAPLSDLDGRLGQTTVRSQVPTQEGHVQSGGVAGLGGKTCLNDVGSCEAEADTIARPDQGKGDQQVHMLQAGAKELPGAEQECEKQQQGKQQQQQEHTPDPGARDTADAGIEEGQESKGQQPADSAGDGSSAVVEGGEKSNGQQVVEYASDGPGAEVEEGEENNGQQAAESASGGPERAWDEVDVTCSLAFGMAEEDDLSMHVYDVHGEEKDGTSDREPLSLEGSENGSDGDTNDVSPELDQQPSPTRWKGPKGIPDQIDLSQVRLAVRSSIRSNDDYILLDCEGNRRIVCKTRSQGGGEETGIMHGKYIPVGEPGQIPAEKMEGVLGNLQGEWLHLPSHGLQGLPETLLVRASVYSPSISRKRLQRGKGGTCDVAKACFAALEVGGSASASLDLYQKPAEEEGGYEFEKLAMDDRHRHQGSQLDVALVYPVPGCFSVTRLNVNHLDPESTVDLCMGDKRRVEVHPRALMQHAFARLQESSPAYESQQNVLDTKQARVSVHFCKATDAATHSFPAGYIPSVLGYCGSSHNMQIKLPFETLTFLGFAST